MPKMHSEATSDSSGTPLPSSFRPRRHLIVEVHVPDRVDDQWVQQVAENAIEEEFGKALTLWSANEDEALQYLRPDPGATHGLLDLRSGVPLVWHILPIV